MSKILDVALTTLAPVAWGTTYVVTTELLPPDRPLLAGVLRALPVGVAIALAARRVPAGIWWWRTAVLGLLNFGCFFPLLFVAAYRLPGGVASTLGAVQPLIVVLLAWPMLRQRITVRTVVVGVCAIGGVAALVLRAGAGLDGIGVGAALLGTALMGTAVVLTRAWGRPVPPLIFVSWQMVAGGIFMIPLLLIFEDVPATLHPASIAGYIYLAVAGTAIAYALWFRGIARLGAAEVAFLGLVNPVVAAAAGYFIRGETLTPLQLVGGGIVLASVIIAQR